MGMFRVYFSSQADLMFFPARAVRYAATYNIASCSEAGGGG